MDKLDINENDEVKTALNFEIVEDTGLVFEEMPTAEDKPAAEEKQAPKKAPAPKAEDIPEPREVEFDIPDTFEIHVGELPSFIEDPTRLSAPYVPRFTDYSENFREKGDPSAKSKEEEKTAIGGEKLGATAELKDEEGVKKVIVKSGTSTSGEPTDESITLFKFDPGEAAKEVIEEPVKPCEPTEEKIAETPVAEELLKEVEPDAPDFKEDIQEETALVCDTPVDETVGFPEIGAPGSPREELSREEEPIGSFESAEKGIAGVNGEYFSPVQKDGVKDRFLDGIISVRVRLWSALAVFIAMTCFEVMYLAGKNPYAVFGGSAYLGIRLLVDFAFCSCLLLLALPEAVRSVTSLFKRCVAPELFLPVGYLVLVMYTVITLKLGEPSYPIFGMLFGVLAVSAIYARQVKEKADYSAFKKLSAAGNKTVFDVRLTRTLTKENMALDGAIDEYSSAIARSFKTGFVSDFYARSRDSRENSLNTLLMLGIGLCLSLVCAVVCYFLGKGSLSYGINSFTLVFMMSCPAFSLLLHKIPFGFAERLALKDKCAFVGEGSVFSLAGVDVVAYEDSEIFTDEDVSIKKVHMYGKVYNMPKAMHQMYALYSVVGGPLSKVFANSLDGKGRHAEGVYIEDDGTYGVLDGHRICAGTEEFMRRHCVRIPEDESRASLSGAETTKIMYCAEDGEVYARFSIRYSFSEEFSMLLPHLKTAGIVPLVYTRDPNLTCDTLKSLTMGEDVIRVIKKDGLSAEKEKVYRRISAPAVTSADKGEAVNLFLLAKKYTAFQAAFGAGELVTMMVGAALAMVFSFSGVLVMPTAPLALLQLGTCVFLAIKSALTFRIGKKDK